MCKVSQRSVNSVVVCFKCEGLGKVSKREFRGHTEGYVTRTFKCPVCKGQKVLNRKLTVELFTI